MAERDSTKLILSGILLLVLFFGSIRILITGGRYFLPLELLGLLALILLSFIAFIGYSRPWGRMLLLVVFLLYLGNLILIRLVQGQLYIILLLLALIGFLIMVPWGAPRRASLPVKPSPKKADEPHSVVFDPAEKAAAKGAVAKTPTRTAIFSPGKYVASSQSNQFHAPACDWAKKIQKARQVWFRDLDEAFEKGYRKHSCLK